MLLGMEAMAPVEPDVPWASAKCVKASKEAMTNAECANLDFMLLSLHVSAIAVLSPSLFRVRAE